MTLYNNYLKKIILWLSRAPSSDVSRFRLTL